MVLFTLQYIKLIWRLDRHVDLPWNPLAGHSIYCAVFGEINTVLMRHVFRWGLWGGHDTELTILRLNMGCQGYLCQICCTFQALDVIPFTCFVWLKSSGHPPLMCGIWDPTKNMACLADHTYCFCNVCINPRHSNIPVIISNEHWSYYGCVDAIRPLTAYNK